jgi:hypothetical protein
MGTDIGDAANLTRMLGERWVEMCGEDQTGLYPKASYFNCLRLEGLVRIQLHRGWSGQMKEKK